MVFSRISREKVQIAGVFAGGALVLLAMMALLAGESEEGLQAWAPEPSQAGRPLGKSIAQTPTERQGSGQEEVEGSSPAEVSTRSQGLSSEQLAAIHGEEWAAGAEEREAEARRQSEEERAAPGFLVGVVQDVSGRPVAGAAVHVRARRRRGEDRRKQAESDQLGRYKLELPPGRYFVWAESEQFANSDAAGARIESEQEREQEPLVLLAAATLRGQVTDQDGLPLQAKIEIRGRRGRRNGPDPTSVSSDAQGNFQIDRLGEGLYRLSAEAEGYVEETLSNVAISSEHGGEARFTLQRAGSLQGILRAPTGDVVAKGWVFVFRDGDRLGQTRSDEEGRFALEGIEPGSLEIYARSDDFSYTCRCQVDVQAGGLTPQDVLLEEGPKIVGTVRSPQGEPLEDVQVQAFGRDGDVRRNAKTDAEGRYEVKNLYAGTYSLRVPHSNGLEPRLELEVSVSNGPLQRDLILPQGATLAGTVTGPDGQPARGTVFAIVEGDYVGRDDIDDEGLFRIEKLPPNDYQLFVRGRSDGLVGTHQISVASDQVVEGVRILMREPAKLTGRVVGPAGQPLEGMRVRVNGTGTPLQRRDETGAEGEFEIQPLYDGSYEVKIDGGSRALAAAKLGVEEVKVASHTVQIEGLRDISLVLTVEVPEPPPQE